ncbi:AMP-binding protein [Maribacter sp. HTCC2170]|uniref:AMP-binding protein n=1 Tax=Maribacter sp. (strain HTCC2170 / KCCM 42371) TaxID=313603 RepID=UPI00006B220B|nr:AMP-binding protein [Maribacter sp. HTCC2170]EAR00308.1 O-succinylbenzoic acid-CoA ligase [Maribacter sp. HTCC2170]
MELTYKRVHPSFKLNGIAITFEDLDEVSYSLIKEGEAFEHYIGAFLLDWIDSSDEIIVKTSGSTGVPKNISIKKQHMVNSALATGDFLNLQAGEKALLCLPAEFIAGKMMLVRAMILGLHLDVVEPLSAPLSITKNDYDFCAMVPFQLENSLMQINRVKTLIVGGASISESLKIRVQEVTTTIYETFGMTETITHIALKKVNNATNEGSIEDERYFKTLPNVTVGKDGRGCLVINAPKINKEPIITNDVVNLMSKTAFEWLGRFDNIINSGGLKLVPEQIEAKMVSIIDSRFFVAAIPDERLGNQMVLFIEGSIDKEELKQKLSSIKSFNKYEIPKEIFCVPRFIQTKNGKLARAETLARFLNSKR